MPVILTKELKRLIDEFGLAEVLRAIAEICERYKVKATTSPPEEHEN